MQSRSDAATKAEEDLHLALAMSLSETSTNTSGGGGVGRAGKARQHHSTARQRSGGTRQRSISGSSIGGTGNGSAITSRSQSGGSHGSGITRQTVHSEVVASSPSSSPTTKTNKQLARVPSGGADVFCCCEVCEEGTATGVIACMMWGRPCHREASTWEFAGGGRVSLPSVTRVVVDDCADSS